MGLPPNAVFTIPPAGGLQILVNFFKNFLKIMKILSERAFGGRPIKQKLRGKAGVLNYFKK